MKNCPNLDPADNAKLEIVSRINIFGILFFSFNFAFGDYKGSDTKLQRF
jgi:hypothetical protein